MLQSLLLFIFTHASLSLLNVCVEFDDVCAIVWVSARRGGRGRRSRTLRALASAARRARVVRDI